MLYTVSLAVLQKECSNVERYLVTLSLLQFYDETLCEFKARDRTRLELTATLLSASLSRQATQARKVHSK